MNADTSSEPRRRWGRRLLVLLGVLILLVILSPLALALPFVKSSVESRMSESLGRPVTIKDASAFWFKGITLEGIRVESPEGFTEPLATIRRVNAKVNLFALLGGKFAATVEVHAPWISFQEDAAGSRNTEGLFPEEAPTEAGREKGPKAPEAEADVDLQLTIRDGVLRAMRPGGELPDEIRDLNLDLHVDSADGITSKFAALAMRAGVGGDDVKVDAEARWPLEGSEPGRVRVRVPPIDLGRMRHLMRGASGISNLQGTLEVNIDGKMQSSGPIPFSGKLQTVLGNLALALEDGTPLSVRNVTMDWDLNPDDPQSAGRAVLEATDLVIGKGSISHQGHRESKVTLRLAGARQNDAYVLTFEEATSSILNAGTVPNEPPLRIAIRDDASQAEGVARATIELAPLARAAGALMGLEPEDTMSGQLKVVARARMDDAGTQMNTGLLGSRIVLPRSWGATGLPPAEVKGKLNVTVSETRQSIQIPTLAGFGINLTLDAAVQDEALERAHLEITGELAEARSLLGAFMDLEPRESLRGRLVAKADVVPEGGGDRIRASAEIRQLRWTDAEGRLIVDEPSITISQDVFVDADGTSFRLDEWKLVAGALQIDLDGSARGVKGGGYDLDATATLSGDAARIAPTLARFLGEDYADMKGEGQVAGKIQLRGPTTNGGAGLLANGQITPGSWNAGGLQLGAPRLTLSRASAAVPQTLTVTSGVNDGTLECVLHTQPTEKMTAWDVTLDVKQVDTSPLLVDRGLGQYLTYLLPTLLPADAATQVLSGRLDADVKLGARDLSGDLMAQTLTGAGEIKMTGGSIGQSTLFQVAGSQGGLGQAGQILARVVPDVGREMEGLAKAMTFRKVESRFDVGQEIVKIRHGLLEGDSATIGFQGTVRFDERVDLKVSVTLGGRGGDALRPVLGSATIPLDVKGTLEKPRVTPTLDASKLTTGALKGLIPGGDGKKNPLDRLKGLIPR